MNKRQAKRLLRVGLALRESPNPSLFTMDAYVHDLDSVCDVFDFFHDDEGNVIDKSGQVVEDNNFCGSPGCALGHYGSRIDLQRLVRVSRTFVSRWRIGGGPALVYRNNRLADYSDSKMQKHFGITEEQAEELFSPKGCNGATSAIDAAEYIEHFVRVYYGSVSL